jgi:AcrR family transcriptional regulator
MRRRGRPKVADIEHRILHAAEILFADRGFAGAAMEDIAWRAGISKTTLYLSFRTKQALIETTLDKMLSNLPSASELTSDIVGDSIEARLLALAKRIVQLLSGTTFDLVRQTMEAEVSSPVCDRIREQAWRRYFDAVERYLVAEAARGDIVLGDARSATSLFIALIMAPESLHPHWSVSCNRPSNDAHVRRAVQVFIGGHAAQRSLTTRR